MTTFDEACPFCDHVEIDGVVELVCSGVCLQFKFDIDDMV